MSLTHLRRGTLVLTAAATLTGTLAAPAAAKPAPQPLTPKPDFTLTLLHANDLESALLPVTGTDGNLYGGAARFVELVQREQKAAVSGRPAAGMASKRGVITVSAGDNFIPGAQLAASEESGKPIYDATAFNAAGFDVSILGNHDFDLSPEFLAEWIEDVDNRKTAIVSNNLNLQGEPALRALLRDGSIVTSHVEKIQGEQVGFIGLTTPLLPQLTSSDEVTVDPNVATIANAQAAAYKRAGVDKVILVSHLQDIDNEVALAGQLRGVDLIIGGGGHELLANAGDPLVPNGVAVNPAYPYPMTPKDAEGDIVPVVTTNALYTYVGRLVVTFDQNGELLRIHDEQSRPLPVLATGAGSVPADPQVDRTVVQPVQSYVDSLAEQVVATSAVPLNGVRNDVRSRETNLADLVTDALLDAGQDGAAATGVTPPVVAVQNGGGIRLARELPAGELTALDTYSILPFANFVSVAPAMPIADFVAGVEHGVAGPVTGGVLQPAGQFAQAAGYEVTYDPNRSAGDRVLSLVLDDGTVIVENGEIAAGAPGTISVATIDFLLREATAGASGDGYPWADVEFTVLPVTQQQAFQSYLTEDLGGVVTAADYPVGGEGRITPVA